MRTTNINIPNPSLVSSRIGSLSFAEVSIRRGLLSLLSTISTDGKIASLSSDSNSSTLSPFFIIGGIDSDTHPLHEAVLKYLALGTSDIYEPILQSQYNTLDDSVLLFTSRNLHLINTLIDNNNQLYSLQKLRGLKLYRVSPREREGDGEIAELYKILSFVDIVTEYQTRSPLYTPLQLSNTNNTANNKHNNASNLVETWPLVQAYALQDIGPGGFFTMRHQLQDISLSLLSMFTHVDTHHLKKLLWLNNNMLIRQYRAFEATITQIRNMGRRSIVLNTETISEPLISYYEFALMQIQSNNNYQTKFINSITHKDNILTRGAGVLVGKYTDMITQGILNSNIDVSLSLQKCGYTINNTITIPPVHCVLQSDDPTTGLRVCRTIALASSRPTAVSKDENNSFDSVTCTNQFLHSIFTLYSLLSEGFRTGLQSISLHNSDTLINNKDKLCTIIKTSIDQVFANKQASLPSTLSYNTNYIIDCDILTAQGQSITSNSSINNSFSPRTLYYITVAITNIMDTQYNISLGSIAMGDTCIIVPYSSSLTTSPFTSTNEPLPSLLVSTVPETIVQRTLPKTTSPNSASGSVVRVLTAHIPVSQVFTVGGKEGEQVHVLTEAVTQVSTLLTPSNIVNHTQNQIVHDPFTVGNYGGGVGKGRKVNTNTSDDNDMITPKPDIETLTNNVTNTLLSKLSQNRLQEIKNSYTDGTFEALVASLGSLIPNGVYHNVTLLTGGTVISSITVTLKVHEKGCILLSPAVGPVIINMLEHIENNTDTDNINNSSNHGLYIILGNDIINNQLHLPSRNQDSIRQAMNPWIDNTLDTVNEVAKSFIDAFTTVPNTTNSTNANNNSNTNAGKVGNGTTTPSVTTPSATASDTLLASPPDVLVFHIRNNDNNTNYTFANTISTSNTISNNMWLGLVLPSDSELRSTIFELLSSWRTSVPTTEITNTNSNNNTSVVDYSSLVKGLLPSSLILGYIRNCPYAWAWNTAWEDCYILETILRNDSENIQTAIIKKNNKTIEIANNSPSNPIPTYFISGVAGSYSSIFGKSMMEVMNASRPGTCAIIDCNDIDSILVGNFTVNQVNTVIQNTLQANPKLSSLLFIAPYHSDPVDIVNILSNCKNIQPSGNITVLNTKQIYMDQRHLQYLPYLSESLSAGWCQALIVIGDTASTTGSTVEEDIEKLLITPTKLNNPSLQIIRLPNILSKTRLFSLSLPMVQSLLREVPLAYQNNKANALRNIALPGWSVLPPILHRSSTILHIYAPLARNYMSGATLSGDSDPSIRRVVEFKNVPASSTISFRITTALEESTVHQLLRKIVVSYVDRPSSVCLEFDYNQQQNNDNPDIVPTYTLPGLCLPISLNNNNTSKTITEGEVFISAWHVTGYLRFTTTLPTPNEPVATVSSDTTDLALIRPALIKDDYVDSDDEESSKTNEDKEESVSNIAATTTTATTAPIVPPTEEIFTTEAPLYAIDATPYAIKLTLIPNENSKYYIPHLQLTGIGLELSNIPELLYKQFVQCRPMLPTPFIERAVSTLSPREISTIVRVHAADCLPADVTYDGAGGYFDMEGKQLPGHPIALTFAERHMIMYNAVCTIWNRFVNMCQVCSTNEENSRNNINNDPNQASVIQWPTEKDEVDLQTAIEKANHLLPTLSLIQLNLPSSVNAPWWIHISRMQLWLKYIPTNVSALRF